MSILIIPKKDIDDTNPLFDDTIFNIIKNSEVGSKNMIK